MNWPIGHSRKCDTCGGCGSYVATQDMAGDPGLPGGIIEALREAAPMPAIVDCPACDGSGEERGEA